MIFAISKESEYNIVLLIPNIIKHRLHVWPLAVVHLALFWKMYVGGGLSTANSSYGEKNHLV